MKVRGVESGTLGRGMGNHLRPQTKDVTPHDKHGRIAVSDRGGHQKVSRANRTVGMQVNAAYQESTAPPGDKLSSVASYYKYLFPTYLQRFSMITRKWNE